MKGVNDDEIVDLARFGRDKGVEVRFIEFMPLDADGVEPRQGGRPGRDRRRDRSACSRSSIVPGERGSAPAARWRYLDGGAEVGVIPTVTKPFCGDCDRVRLTAEGQFRNCLFATDEFDLRARCARRDRRRDRRAHRGRGRHKWAGHQINQVHFIRPRRSR
jgi:GTP 3',8-cyclase